MSSDIGELGFPTSQELILLPRVYDNNSTNNLTWASAALLPYFNGDEIHGTANILINGIKRIVKE